MGGKRQAKKRASRRARKRWKAGQEKRGGRRPDPVALARGAAMVVSEDPRAKLHAFMGIFHACESKRPRPS